ncbi:MAG TPA: MFS transporter [Vicinamibacteria bacterium]|nr:MFS transporter [Vicinamibacteria bacterium]
MADRSLLERLGLHRRELRAWAGYDFGNSAFMTTVVLIFPVYFVRVPAAALSPALARSRVAFASSAAVVLVGLLGPWLGAVADLRGRKKAFLGAFLALGVAATAALALASSGRWLVALVAFVLANVGFTSTLAFYNALLPGIASVDEIDRVSTGGFALGYLGGGLLFALDLCMIGNPGTFGLADSAAATRLSFLSVAAWWALFSIPLFQRVPEPTAAGGVAEAAGTSAARAALGRLAASVRELRRRRDAGLVLLAFFLYNEGINTIIRMATLFGDDIRIPAPQMMLALLMVQVVGMPFAFAFGWLADRIGARQAIFVALAVYAGIAMYAFVLRTVVQFFVLALLVATVQGGAQALSRSLFATLVPRDKAGEMFGFFGVCDRVGNGAIGSLLFGLMLLLTGSSRPAVLALVIFFAAGGLVLSRVDIERGRRLAREAEATAA